MTNADAASVVDAWARVWAVPGVAVAVTDDQGIVWQHVHGFADLARGAPLTADHLLQIGSISKVATAMLVLRAADEGLLGLDQPVSEALPWLPEALRGPSLTLRRLLSHTAGLVGSVDALPDEGAQLLSFRGTCTPGETFRYSNVGYLLLGQAVARAVGTPFPEALRRGVLTPSGMRSSPPSVSYDDRDRYAVGCEPARADLPWTPGDALVPAPFFETTAGDGSIAATLGDLAAFARVLLRRGRGDDGTVISEDAYAKMIDSLAPEGEEVLVVPGASTLSSSRYGLGINVETWDDGVVLSHGGGMVGFASFLLTRPGDTRAVVVLTNADGDSPVAEAIARTVDLLFSDRAGEPGAGAVLDPELWAGATDAVRTSKGYVVPPRLPLDAHGDFATPGGRTLSVTATEDGTRVTASLDGVSAPLRWTWNERRLARLDGVSRFGLTWAGRCWLSGDAVYAPKTTTAAEGADAATAVSISSAAGVDPRCGHYRSYTPWYPHLRIVRREGDLFLLAPRGVEAPTDDQILVPLHDGTYRISADPAAPERLRFGPVVDDACTWVDRDGCIYSRTASP
ncbi:serine hydrolase domain-containing protein [Microbacterium trichothecenolyticum]|uniref:D-alanyl-D-alanine carboxypeptidase n=1 Tax=Microbacterium trichothecenolyticum TaxID=69370 RepID=A0ABU0TUY1_MICTR|nr:serine hydrolase domain-containing protein [Microbacterium trichothecenolyticum]MDQ1123477.1 D-alanyl-D-alanine carboxypeptidase [Microbacterium trichothecenolyticum]